MKPTGERIEHDCEVRAEKRLATAGAPYHFVGSGLDNVYLVGVTYYVCPDCQLQSAEIPALKNLFDALARTIVEKQSALTGPELRFLRKHLRKKAIDFAPLVGITPQHLSKLENSDDSIDSSLDKLIRLSFAGLSGDKQIRNAIGIENDFERWLASIHGEGKNEGIYAKRMRNNKWQIRVQAAAA